MLCGPWLTLSSSLLPLPRGPPPGTWLQQARSTPEALRGAASLLLGATVQVERRGQTESLTNKWEKAHMGPRLISSLGGHRPAQACAAAPAAWLCAPSDAEEHVDERAAQRPRVPMCPAPAPAQQDGDPGASPRQSRELPGAPLCLLASTLGAPRRLEPTVLRGHREAPRRGPSPHPPQALQTPQART